MTPRKRRRRGARRGPLKNVFLLAVVLILIFGVGSPTASFSLGEADRGTSVVVTDDTDGVVSLNKTSALKEGTSGGCLVGVTNQIGETASVEVSLSSSSESLGALKTDPNGTVKGNSVEFSLDDGASDTVYMDVEEGTAGNTTYYSVKMSTSGIEGVLVERSAPIKETAEETCD